MTVQTSRDIQEDRRQVLLDEVDRSGTAIEDTVEKLKNHFQPKNLVREITQPAIEKLEERTQEAQKFAKLNPILSFSVAAGAILILKKSAANYRKANNNQHGVNRVTHVSPTKNLAYYLGQASNALTEKARSSVEGLVQESANVVNQHMKAKTQAIEGVAHSAVKSMTIAAIDVEENMILEAIRKSGRGYGKKTAQDNKQSDNDTY